MTRSLAAAGRYAREGRRPPDVRAFASNDGLDRPGRSTPYHLPVEQIARHAVAPARHAVAPARHAVAPAQWQRRSAGDGTQGPRRFAWALVRVLPPQPSGVAPTLLIRRPLDAPDAPKELA